MKIEVRYYTKTGNTKKLADTIADKLNIEAKTVEHPLSDKADILFLGSSVYAGKAAPEIEEFLKRNSSYIGTLVSFSTAAFAPSTYRHLKKLASENSIRLSEKEFHCRGSLLFLHKDKPDSYDLAAARVFAAHIVEDFKQKISKP